MTTHPLRWSEFKGDWQDFQRLCADIVEDHGYIAEMRSAGGGDEGRDIDAFEIISPLPQLKRKIAFWVECKSRFAARPHSVPLDEVSKCILFAQTEGVPALVFMTNHKLSNEAKGQISRLSQLQNFGLGVTYIEQEVLERLILERPTIYSKYFNGSPPPPSPPLASIRIDCILRSGKLSEGKRTLRLQANNTGFRAAEIEISGDQLQIRTVTVGPFSKAEILLPLNTDIVPLKRADLKLVSKEADVEINVDDRTQEEVLSSTLHEFADPLQLANKIVSRFINGLDSYIVGNEGTGKTALAANAVQQSGYTSIYVNADLIDETTRLVGMLAAQIDLFTGDRTDGAHNVRPVSGKAANAPDGRFASDEAIAMLFERLKQKRDTLIVIIDNVHSCRAADHTTLKRLLVERLATAFVFTARPSGFLSPEIEATINKPRVLDTGYVTRLGAETIRANLRVVVNQISSDDSTREFLEQFQSLGNLQSFKLVVDLLRLKGIVADVDGGRKCELRKPAQPLDLSDYGSIVEAILSSLSFDNDGAIASSVLGLSAIWGEAFPSDLAIFAVGAPGERALNSLRSAGILRETGEVVIDFRFGHRSTAEIVEKSIPATRRKHFHSEIVRFLDTLGKDSPLSVPTRRARHLAGAGDTPAAANLLYQYLVETIERQNKPAALAVALEALSLRDRSEFASLPVPPDVGREADLLTLIIELGYFCNGPGWGEDFLRRFEFLAYSDGSSALRGRAAYFWSRYHIYQQNDSLALSRSEEAVRLLSQTPSEVYVIRAINRLGNIQKNRRNFRASALLHREAATRARRSGRNLELSQSIRELGATFLEAGRPAKTLILWRRSCQIAETTGNLEEILSEKANLAYILALNRTSASDAAELFDHVDRISERFGLYLIRLKNLINWGNWLFHEMGQAASACAKIAEALKLSSELDFPYGRALAVWSYISFAVAGAAVPRSDYEKELGLYVDKHLLASGRLDRWADNRATMLAKFLLSYANNALDARARNSLSSAIGYFPEADGNAALDESEKDNPYFRKQTRLWAVYY